MSKHNVDLNELAKGIQEIRKLLNEMEESVQASLMEEDIKRVQKNARDNSS